MTKLTIESSTKRFTDAFARSGEFTKAGKGVIPGGYSRNSFNFGPHAIYAERGEGAYIDTVDGHRLLDLNNNFTVNALGHNHPVIMDALSKAMESGFSFGNPTELETTLARILIERIPSVEMVQFSCSASESCLSAIRIARAFTGRTKIAKFEGGYHGFTDALAVSAHPHGSECGDSAAPEPMADSGGVPLVDVQNVVTLTQNDTEGTARILREHASELACVIMELESGAGGFVTLDQGFVEVVREITRELEIPLIFDETVTLRAGIGGMQALYGVVPDLTVMGKIIGGGLPLGAVGGREEIMRVLEDGRATISGTHHGHKLALAAGIASMQALDHPTFDRLNAQALRIMTEMNDWSARRSGCFKIFGKGISHLGYAYMRSPELEIRTHRDYWTNVDEERSQICSLELACRGFFPVHRGNFSLSTPMTDSDIDSFVYTLQEIVSEVEE